MPDHDQDSSFATGMITWVYCHDLDEAAGFYGDMLGLTLWRDAGTARIYHASAQGFIGICTAFGDRVVQPAGGMITLLRDDVDGCYARLKARGASLRGAPEELPQFGIYSFFCKDPNGYVIEVQRFLDQG